MAPHAESIVLNGATSQYDRWLRALDAHYAEVDGRSVNELLDFAVRFGRLVNFYNLHDEAEGDWVLFFLSDPTMLLAAISSEDFTEVESSFARLERLAMDARPFERQFEFLRDAFSLILELARRINGWLAELGAAGAGEGAALTAHAISAEIEADLGGQLRLLKAYDEGAGLRGALGRPVGLNYEGFLSVWGLDDVRPDGSIYRGRTDTRKVTRAVPHLTPIFDSFLRALAEFRRLAPSALSGTFEQSDHKAHVALYIAFVELFRTAQATVNTLSGRYLDFYYRDILRERNRGPVPDNVYLTFTLADKEGLSSASVPAGTTFPAGQDADGRDILYASDKALTVTAATVTNLQTLRVEQGPLFFDPPAPARVVRRVLSSVVDAAKATDAAGTGEQVAWATFGSSEVGTRGTQVTEPATLGFAVATPYLLLTGGARLVTLNVAYTDAYKRNVLDPLLAEISLVTGLFPEEVFAMVLRGAFTLYASTQTGWFQVETYEVRLSPEFAPDPTFELEFELPPSAPPIAPYDAASAGEGSEAAAAAAVTDDPAVNASDPAPALPTLKAYLRQTTVVLAGIGGAVEVYPLSLLYGMEATAFRVDADVSGLSEVQIENADGAVDTSTPFHLLGGVPVIGSYALIRHRELFVKTIEWLQLAVSWFNLPQNEDGFAGYYKYYVIGPDGRRQPGLFDNQSFHVGIGVQNPGRWFVLGGSPPGVPARADAYMFRTLPDCGDPVPAPDGALCKLTSFDNLVVCPASPPPYYDPAASALRLELTAPSYAFGNSIYSQNVLNSVIQDLPDAEQCQEKCLAECRALSDAAGCVAKCMACLSGCPESPAGESPPAPSCAETCVNECVECLLAQAAQCLGGCLTAIQGAPYEGAVGRVLARMKMKGDPPDVELTQWLKLYLEWLGERLPPPLKGCVEKCLVIVGVARDLLLCVEQAGTDVAAFVSCLEASGRQLKDAYSACLTRCADECMSLKKELKYPNDPYVPLATSLTVNYSAGCTFGGDADTCGQVFHLLPFGGYEPLQPSASAPVSLLPQFGFEGSLYLGFSQLIPPQNLTLLFQLTAGGDSPRSGESPPVAWEYLSENHWTCLGESQVRADTTNGLQNSGVITLALPTYDPAGGTVLAGGGHWLRACIERQPDSFPDTTGLYPHVVLCTGLDNGGTGEHLRQPLPPHTINSSVEDLPGVGSINQPTESFGGRPPEERRAFVIRVGERLRHKDRAILGWDYERLVLERFPTIWQVCALAARTPHAGDSPGDVLVVVVKGPDGVTALDPTAPVAASDLLSQIKTYLEGRVSQFVQLHVVNPNYVRVGVSASVQFRDGEDPGANIVRLNDELVKYLSPWFYNAARAARGGSYASESDISEFIQTRPYVEAMDLISFRYEPEPQNLDWYFLTSARQHRIQEA